MATTSRIARTHGHSRPAGFPGRAYSVLAALAVVLVAAFVFAPRPLAGSMAGRDFGDQRHLTDSLSRAFVGYWGSGDRTYSPDLAKIIDYWRYYHVVKAVAATVLLIVLVALGVRLWQAFLRAGEGSGAKSGGAGGAGSRRALAAAGVAVTALALFTVALVMANVQGAIAPFSSLMSMLPVHTSHGALAGTLDQVRQRLADYPHSGAGTPPALKVMVDDFSRYHAVIAVAASLVAVVLAGLSVAAWKRFAGTAAADRRTRRLFRWFGLGSAVLAAAVVVVAVANAMTTADAAPALLAFFKGGW